MTEIHFHPVPQPVSIEKHRCSRCHARTTLTTIEPHAPGVDRFTFTCRECRHVETLLVMFH